LDYTPFGQVIPSTSSNPRGGTCYSGGGIRQEFTSKERDPESGLDFFLARYYSGAGGRFTGVDPANAAASAADPQSWNGYTYARNNPLLYTDPDGETYRVCPQGGQCFDTSDEEFAQLQRNPGNGVSLSNGDINVFANGQWVQAGTYWQTDVDLTSWQVRGVAQGMRTAAPAVNLAAAATATVIGAAAGGIAYGAAGAMGLSEASAFIPRQALQFATKQAARDAVAKMGLTAAQATAALSAIARATSTSTINIIRAGQQVIVSIVRAGQNGYQAIDTFIDQSGGKQVIQKAYDAAGDLSHYDPK
jgi:RHS repeat-associated protein